MREFSFKAVIVCWSGLLRLISMFLSLALIMIIVEAYYRWSLIGDEHGKAATGSQLGATIFSSLVSGALLTLLAGNYLESGKFVVKILDAGAHLALALIVLGCSVPFIQLYVDEAINRPGTSKIDNGEDRLFPGVLGIATTIVYGMAAIAIWFEKPETLEHETYDSVLTNATNSEGTIDGAIGVNEMQKEDHGTGQEDKRVEANGVTDMETLGKEDGLVEVEKPAEESLLRPKMKKHKQGQKRTKKFSGSKSYPSLAIK